MKVRDSREQNGITDIFMYRTCQVGNSEKIADPEPKAHRESTSLGIMEEYKRLAAHQSTAFQKLDAQATQKEQSVSKAGMKKTNTMQRSGRIEACYKNDLMLKRQERVRRKKGSFS